MPTFHFIHVNEIPKDKMVKDSIRPIRMQTVSNTLEAESQHFYIKVTVSFEIQVSLVQS